MYQSQQGLRAAEAGTYLPEDQCMAAANANLRRG